MPWDFWLIFLFLGVVVPWRGHVRLRKLLARPAIDTTEKLTLYAATIAFQWLMLGVVAWRALARGLTPSALGLTGHLSAKILVAGFLGAAIIGGLQWLNLRRMGKMEGAAPDLMRKLTSRILPQSLVELLPYLALAVTAGVCEEFSVSRFRDGGVVSGWFADLAGSAGDISSVWLGACLPRSRRRSGNRCAGRPIGNHTNCVQ